MNTILCIDDCTPEAKHVMQFALNLTRKHHARLIIGATKASVPANKVSVAAMDRQGDVLIRDAETDAHLTEFLTFQDDYQNVSAYAVTELDISGMNTAELARFVNQNSISVIVKAGSQKPGRSIFKPQILLNKVQAPLLLVPQQPVKMPAKLAYLTDLRYCRTDLLRFLVNLTAPLETHLAIAHLPMPGLPDLEPTFAMAIFNDICKEFPDCDRLVLHHIPDQSIATVADVLVNGMQYDGLVLANHSSHYRNYIEDNTFANEPGLAGTPLLLFPG